MKTLTKGEEQIMQVLWKLGKGFLKDIVNDMKDPKPHPNTIATLLKILIEKGYVTYETQGRNNCYQPSISKDEYGKRSINKLIKGYFEGSPAILVSHFVKDNKLSMAELEALMLQIRNAKKNNL